MKVSVALREEKSMGTIRSTALVLTLTFGLAAQAANAADINVGIILPQTGSASSFGVPMSNAVSLLPPTIAGQKVNYILLDSRSDVTQATSNARKLITENKIDVLIGDAITPTSLALVPVAGEAKTPWLATSSIKDLAYPVDQNRRWAFKIVPNDDTTAPPVVKYFADHGVKTLGIMGFNDAYLQIWTDLFDKLLPPTGIKVVAVESFERAATSTTPQALKLIAAKPDAIFLAAGGTPAVIPVRDLRQRGYKGLILGGHGIGLTDFIDRGGKDAEGVVLVGEPFIVYKDLPANSPYRELGEKFATAYKAKFNVEPPIMGAHIADCGTLLEMAIPQALKKGQPGTQEFRDAIRDALENVKGLHLNNGLLTNSPTEHAGYDPVGMVVVVVKEGAFHLVK
jgi:branched-chain amino acid transport system substrate-binding protein